MIVTVKFPVNIRVFDPEIRAKVENTNPRRQKRLGKFRGESVRQRQKDNGRFACDLFCIRIGKLERNRFLVMSQARKNVRR